MILILIVDSTSRQIDFEHAKIAQACNPALKAVDIHLFTLVLVPSMFNPVSNQKRHVSACDASSLHPKNRTKNR